jgi:hypothetical protein
MISINPSTIANIGDSIISNTSIVVLNNGTRYPNSASPSANTNSLNSLNPLFALFVALSRFPIAPTTSAAATEIPNKIPVSGASAIFLHQQPLMKQKQMQVSLYYF